MGQAIKEAPPGGVPITPSRRNFWSIMRSRQLRNHAITPNSFRNHAITPNFFRNHARFSVITPSRLFFLNHTITPIFFSRSRLHAPKKGQSRHHAIPGGSLTLLDSIVGNFNESGVLSWVEGNPYIGSTGMCRLYGWFRKGYTRFFFYKHQ